MEKDMTKGRPLPVILKFMLPLIIGNIFQQLYNMADTIIVGRYVGADALAAVGSTGTIMFLIVGFSQGITAGFSVLTSQRFGAKDTEGVKASVANGILLSLIFTVLISGLSMLSMHSLLKLMNTPDNIFQDAYTYVMIISAGIIATIFYNLFSSFLRAVGNSRLPLIFLVFSAVLNVALDLVLIINFKMGVAGAAYATIFSQGISAILCLIYIYVRMPDLAPDRRHWKLHGRESRNQLAMGIPMALQFAITASGTMIMQAAINLFGSDAVASYTAASKLQNLVTQGMMAMGQTMATYSGQNFGKGDIKRIRQGVKAALGASVVYAVGAAVLVVLLLKPALGLFFTGDVDMSSMFPWARTYIYMSIIFYIPLSTIFVFRNTMQGCGYGFLPMMGGVSELIARLVVAMISMAVASYPLACFCDPAAWFTAAVFTGVSYLFVMKDIRKKYENPESLSHSAK
ncbi:MATE family efflux transporter [Blautia sp. HCP3S3_H10_1]|uniref:MATE family efflux transporter n=1 Tax=unclassified Blautia TaxID=2648079 RepID=UPI003F92A450